MSAAPVEDAPTGGGSSLRAARAAGVAAIQLRKQQSGSFLDTGGSSSSNAAGGKGGGGATLSSGGTRSSSRGSSSVPATSSSDAVSVASIPDRDAAHTTDDIEAEAEVDQRVTERFASLSRMVISNARIRGQHALKLANLTSRLDLNPSQLPSALLSPLPIPFSSTSSASPSHSNSRASPVPVHSISPRHAQQPTKSMDEKEEEHREYESGDDQGDRDHDREQPSDRDRRSSGSIDIGADETRTAAERDGDTNEDDVAHVSDEMSHLTTELAKAYKLLSEREDDLRLAARNYQSRFCSLSLMLAVCISTLTHWFSPSI
jgi:hypothetical protein